MKAKALRITICVALLLLSASSSGQDDHAHPTKPQAPMPPKDEHTRDEGGHAEHRDEVKLSEAALKQNGIRIAPTTRRSLTASFVAPARIAFNAEATAHVGSAVNGRVVEIKVRQGDQVKKDDVLLVVESTELGRSQSQFLQRRTEAEVAAAALPAAKDASERARKLFEESQGIALSEVQKREVEYRVAAGLKATSQAAAEAAENELHLLGLSQSDVEKLAQTKEIKPQFVIRAPIDAQVVAKEITLGELVAPDKEKLLVLVDTKSLWVIADVPEVRLSQIGVGTPAEIQVPSMPGESISGEVSMVSVEVEPATRVARVRIVVANDHEKLKPGMFAKATLWGRPAQATLAVPEEAIQTVEGKPSVFVPVEGETNTFARREVVVGKSINGYVPVVSGLKDGERLAVSGTFIMKAELGKGSAEHDH